MERMGYVGRVRWGREGKVREGMGLDDRERVV